VEQTLWTGPDFEGNLNWAVPNAQGTQAVLGGNGDLAYIFDLATRKRERTLALPFSYDASSLPAASWSPDGSRVALVRNVYYDTFEGKSYAVFSSSGQLLLDGTVANLPSIQHDFNPVGAVSWSTDGKRVRILGRTLDLEARKELFAFNTSNGTPYDGPLSPDGKVALMRDSAADYRPGGFGLKTIDVETGGLLLRDTPPGNDVRTRPVPSWKASWSPDGQRIVVAVNLNGFSFNNQGLYQIYVLSSSSLLPLQNAIIENISDVSSLNWVQQENKNYISIGQQNGSLLLFALE